MHPQNTPEISGSYRYLDGTEAMDVGKYLFPPDFEFPAMAMQSFCSSSLYPLEVSEITETPQTRALVASINHKEAEKRRRERINSHFDKLRNLLPCNSKTDKASLLAKVIERVKELKQESSEMTTSAIFPSESDEIAVISNSSEEKMIVTASFCCEDRSDLYTDLIETLKSLNLKAVKAEMATLGGRSRTILVVTRDGDCGHTEESMSFLRNALKNLVGGSSSSDRLKRRRTLDRRTMM